MIITGYVHWKSPESNTSVAGPLGDITPTQTPLKTQRIRTFLKERTRRK